ncbi:MAG: hypothetical protein WA082_00800 [Candidatus Moraniibacteriota bacterium]
MLNNVIAVVRSYNEPNIGDHCSRLIGVVGAIVVVTPTNLEPEGLTENALRPVMLDNKNVHQVKTLMKDHNSWSAMLNVGLGYVRALNSQRNERFGYLLNHSNTASFAESHLSAMRSRFENDHSNLGVVGTTFAGYLADGTREPLGRAYDHPRNTGMMINLRVFDSDPLLAGFDPRWDGAGGMEDYDFIGKMRALSPYKAWLLHLQVPLLIGRHRDQAEYTKLMEGGIAAVDAYHQEMGWR